MSTPIAHRAGPRQWAGLAILALPTMLLGLDVTVLYLALPALAADLRPDGTETLWIMDSYGFLIAGFLISMGTLGDRIGRRRLLMIGAVAFGLVSILAAYATGPLMLIAARAALGVAGATLMPSTLSLISTMFLDARQRAVAIGVWATMFALGMAAGPVVGGILLDHFWWGSAFLVAVPIIVVLLVSGPLLLPEYRDPRAGRFDLLSGALSLAAILPVVYGVKHAAADGFDLVTVVVPAIGIGFGVLFVRRQRTLADPLLDLTLFTSRGVGAALSVLLVGLMGVGGVMYLVTQYLQFVDGLSPFEAGLWMGPPALAMFVAAIAAPLLARRIRPGLIVAATLAAATVGYLLLTQVEAAGSRGLVVTGFALVYLGLGAIAALGTDLVVGSAPPAKSGSAAAMSETVQELGVAAGVAILGSLTAVVYRDRVADQLPSDLPAGVAATAGDSLAGAVSVAGALPEEALQGAAAAFTAGMNTAALVAGAAILALAIVSATVLRHVGTIGSEGYEETGQPERAAS
ncbi:DHA2 family multidrug resistance protein-like MFS transporter [Actinoalloteichus hoggarensis]|uniref:Antiseptic resistance protein n=1 Tax=Actinoalloteichus hoggarensis TaxID=1470176 RepID=A0A221W638_9PSEU|nr:MFS transporter [Actinoalloteichus hoggarensis]ASO21154.1 Antiseptic resistance protein [Actinoalloteichus hoggarensis]MBB5921083.1 DHA2 family multidrug resistance protein-like MFS transporter [Actinoalloteichus hoggarensis]